MVLISTVVEAGKKMFAKTTRVDFFDLYTRPENCVFVKRASLVIPKIVYFFSIHPPVTEGTHCEMIQKTLVLATTVGLRLQVAVEYVN